MLVNAEIFMHFHIQHPNIYIIYVQLLKTVFKKQSDFNKLSSKQNHCFNLPALMYIKLMRHNKVR